MLVETSGAPTVKPQGQWHHGNLRESLVHWGIAQLREVSLDHLSLRQIAKSAGVSVGPPPTTLATRKVCWPPWLHKAFGT